MITYREDLEIQLEGQKYIGILFVFQKNQKCTMKIAVVCRQRWSSSAVCQAMHAV